MENLKVWESVKTTDLAYTKESKNGGYKSTSINGHYMVMKATELFGVCGIGWGYEVLEERFNDGEEILRLTNEKTEVIGHCVNHTLKLRLWFKHEGEKGEIIDYGHTPYKYWNRTGGYWICDSEVSKKSLTDAIKRCLSKIGICADIFLGEWDNQEYVKESQEEVKKERELKRIEAEEKAQDEKDRVMAELIEKIQNFKTPSDVAKSWANIARKAAAVGLSKEQTDWLNNLGFQKQQELNASDAAKQQDLGV